jgi:hypothetical protein
VVSASHSGLPLLSYGQSIHTPIRCPGTSTSASRPVPPLSRAARTGCAISSTTATGSRLERDGDRVRLIAKGGYNWARRYPCRRTGSAFFFKQGGGVRKDKTGRTYRGQTFDEMPSALAVL